MNITKEFKAGAIVIATFLAFWYMFQFLKGKDLFTSENFYNIKFNDVSGLEKTKPVTIGGLKVGVVESIEPKYDANKKISFIVKIRVKKDFTITQNSIAEIHEPGLMSGKEIQIYLGNSSNSIDNGGFITGKIKNSLMTSLGEQVSPLKDSVSIVLNSLDRTLNTSNQTFKNVNSILDQENNRNIRQLILSLNETVKAYKNTSDQINQLISMNNSKITQVLESTNKAVASANETMKSANDMIKTYKGVGEKINHLELEKNMASIQGNLNNLNKILEKVNSGQGNLGKIVNDEELYKNLNSTTKSLDALLKDFKESPKRYVHFSIFGRKDKKENSISNEAVKEETLKN